MLIRLWIFFFLVTVNTVAILGLYMHFVFEEEMQSASSYLSVKYGKAADFSACQIRKVSYNMAVI